MSIHDSEGPVITLSNVWAFLLKLFLVLVGCSVPVGFMFVTWLVRAIFELQEHMAVLTERISHLPPLH